MQREHDGPADWIAIKKIKSALRIPIICNGSIRSRSDALLCLEFTGADAIMSATGLLRNPKLFVDEESLRCSCGISDNMLVACMSLPRALSSSRDYLQIAKQCWPSSGDISVNGKDKIAVIRDHLLSILQIHLMDVYHDIWSLLASRSVQTIEQFEAILEYISHHLLQNSCIGGSTMYHCTYFPALSLKSIKKGVLGGRAISSSTNDPILFCCDHDFKLSAEVSSGVGIASITSIFSGDNSNEIGEY